MVYMFQKKKKKRLTKTMETELGKGMLLDGPTFTLRYCDILIKSFSFWKQ